MNNFNKPGNVVTVVAPAAVSSGVAFLLGTLLCIPVTDADSGADVAAQIEGVVELPKLSTAVVTAGAKLIWDASAGEVIVASAATGDLNDFGVAVKAAGNGTTTVLVKLTPGVGTVEA